MLSSWLINGEIRHVPNKYAQKKKWSVPKQKYKVVNWTDYSQV